MMDGKRANSMEMDLEYEKNDANIAISTTPSLSASLQNGELSPRSNGIKFSRRNSNSRLPNRKSLRLSKSLVQDNIPIEIVPGIFLGSVHAAFNQVALQSAGITHVINTAGLPATFPDSFTYLTINLRDRDSSNLLSCIPAANLFIESALAPLAAGERSGVLVHCSMGRSRSPAIIMAYLMNSRRITFEEAFEMVRSKRSVVCINDGFSCQLKAYDLALYDIHEAKQYLIRHRLNTIVSLPNVAGIFQKKPDQSQFEVQSSSAAATLLLARTQHPARLKFIRPCSPSVKVIPPLRSMDLEFVCMNCGVVLFYSSSIIRPHRDEKRAREALKLFASLNKFTPKFSNAHVMATEFNSHPGIMMDLPMKQQLPNIDFVSSAEEIPVVPCTPSIRNRRLKGFHTVDDDTAKTSKPGSFGKDCAVFQFERQQTNSNSASTIAETTGSGDVQPQNETPMEKKNNGQFKAKVNVFECTAEDRARWIERMHVINTGYRNMSGDSTTNSLALSFSASSADLGSSTFAKISRIADQDRREVSVLQHEEVFLEPMTWMLKQGRFEDLKGSLNCPKCNFEFGQYDLDGMRTSWGETLSPAFKILTKFLGSRERPPTRDSQHTSTMLNTI